MGVRVLPPCYSPLLLLLTHQAGRVAWTADASEASVHQIEKLWDGDGSFLGLAHVTVAGAKHHGLKHVEVTLRVLG